MRRPAAVTALFALAALVPAGCVSLRRSPEVRFFVLRALVEPPAVLETPPAGQLGLLPARVPAALARPQLVSAPAPGELRVDPLVRWAEPLDEGVTRTLAENLGALLPRQRVLRWPWPAGASLRARLSVELQAFGPQPDGVGLRGELTLLDPKSERALVRRSFALARPTLAPPASGGGTRGRPGTAERETVEAMSALLADLARLAAQSVAELPPAENPASPSGSGAGSESGSGTAVPGH